MREALSCPLQRRIRAEHQNTNAREEQQGILKFGFVDEEERGSDHSGQAETKESPAIAGIWGFEGPLDGLRINAHNVSITRGL